MAGSTEFPFDPVEKAKEFFDIVKTHFTPGDMPQGLLISPGGTAMIGIDAGFFSSVDSRRKLTSVLRDKALEMGAIAYIQVADSFRLIRNEARFMEEMPPSTSNVEWLADNGYGTKQDCLLGVCQTKLGTWIVRQDYRLVGESLQWGDLLVQEGQPEPHTELFHNTIRIPIV